MPTDEPIPYFILAGGRAILCTTCGFTSYHPRDVSERYCGICKRFHENEALNERLQKLEAILTGEKAA